MFTNSEIISKVLGPFQETGMSKEQFTQAIHTCMNMARKYPLKRNVKVVVSECDKFISIHVASEDQAPMSWEQLQEIKDSSHEGLDFIEVYPKADEIVNKANVRHLIHIKDFNVPKLSDLERDSYINQAETII